MNWFCFCCHTVPHLDLSMSVSPSPMMLDRPTWGRGDEYDV